MLILYFSTDYWYMYIFSFIFYVNKLYFARYKQHITTLRNFNKILMKWQMNPFIFDITFLQSRLSMVHDGMKPTIKRNLKS